MQSHMVYRPWVSVLVLSIFVISACSTPEKIDATLDRPPLVETLPITAGIDYSDELVAFKYSVPDTAFAYPCVRWWPAPAWEISLRKPTVDLFRQVYRALFDNVVELSNGQKEVKERTDGIEIVISQTISSFHLDCGPAIGAPVACSASVEYEISARTPEGHLISQWSVTGHATEKSGLETTVAVVFLMGYIHCASLRDRVIPAAMRDAAARFIKEFVESPQVQNWLQHERYNDIYKNSDRYE